jgi:hypothetical protein
MVIWHALGENKRAKSFGVEPKGKRPLERHVDGRIILNWIFKKLDWRT